jgi:glyoxylase-like metal-dependent hydrolase (beta-lactamase superfamily II)
MTNNTTTQEKTAAKIFNVAPGVWGMKDIFVNFYMVANQVDNTWVLVDAGLKTSAPKIRAMARELFGENSKPSAIVLTHGHFDHIGSLRSIAEEWDVPVYAHYLEMPYLAGKSSYPSPDPTVGGGIMPVVSVVFPRGPINIWNRLNILNEGDSLPNLPEWKFFHTPGHAPGHISLFREADKVLIAGDAIITTNQQSALSIMFQKKQLCGPPKYFTYDWQLAKQSVKVLMDLEPEIVATGHGKPMQGSEMREALHDLYNNFNKEAVPEGGRYTDDPAVADATGFVYIPPVRFNKRKAVIALLSVTVIIASLVVLQRKNAKKQED